MKINAKEYYDGCNVPVECNRVDVDFKPVFRLFIVHPEGQQIVKEFNDLTKAHESFRQIVQDILWDDYDNRWVSIASSFGHTMAMFQKAHP